MRNEEIFLVGVMEFASIKKISVGEFYIGVRFKAGVLGALWGKDISLFNDKLVPLENIDKSLEQKLLHLDKSDKNIEKLLDEIFEKVFENVKFDQRVLEATRVINKSSKDIVDIAKSLDISQKQLERLFVKHVGVTPKKYTRFIRFIKTHKHLTKAYRIIPYK